ncbi:Uncharacterised protein [Vibrio cholerae]|nr:Uncharacterised protein [Vibrio cholerae]CSI53282.1 Uncharacterised protein [Vibrio cholerae]
MIGARNPKANHLQGIESPCILKSHIGITNFNDVF